MFCPHVKKIEAVITQSRVDAVRAEFDRLEVCGKLTLTDVLQGEIHAGSIRPAEATVASLDSGIKIELIVADHQVDTAVNVILQQAGAGPPASGTEVDYARLRMLHVHEILQIAPPAIKRL